MPDFSFYVGDMTSLRYAIPFIKTTKRLLGLEIHLAYNSSISTGKYNDITRTLKKFFDIVEENQLSLIDVTTTRLNPDTNVCVENVHGGIESNKLISIQHGFDWTGLHKNSKNSTYLVSETFFKTQIENLGHKSEVMPIPVVFWDWDFYWKNIGKQDDTRHSVTLFYPEQGLHNEFKEVYKRLKNLGYKTYIKQRAKNQSVPSDLEEIFYDSLWYPSESIMLPMMSDFIVGFGTSAYTDLIHIDRRFFDFCLPDYSKLYYKPDSPNFSKMTGNFNDYLDRFCKLDFCQCIIQNKRSNPCDDLLISTFLQRVLQ